MPSSEGTIPSSPAPAVFSDEVTRSATPPSSPPGFPWEQQDVATDQQRQSKPPANSAFSMLGKRKVLEDVSENARPAKKVASSSKSRQAKGLSQMQISLGQAVQKKCRTCGMEYVPSSSEDRKLHDKYHKQNVEGYDVGKDFVMKTDFRSVFDGVKDGDRICALDCFDSHHRKQRGQAALEIVQRELGAVEISKQQLWDENHCKDVTTFDPTYRALLYIRGTKCIGLLLVQKITEAYHVIEPAMVQTLDEQTDQGQQLNIRGALATLQAKQEAAKQHLRQPIELSEVHTAQLGISRIWTSSMHRKKDIAITLLDTAVKDLNKRAGYSKALKKRERSISSWAKLPPEYRENWPKFSPVLMGLERRDAVAFSQPTEAGIRLARRWFGKAYGWNVYVD